jgi:disulfide bond formation protein DsbB
MSKGVHPYLFLSWTLSLLATAGSLYFSEVAGFVPCTFCWYQRILMYPFVLLLGIAVYRRDPSITLYILPLSVLGVLVAGYHYALQKIPFLQTIESCKTGIPCSGEYINWFGFITIPFLSLVAFSLISLSLVVGIKKDA